MGRTSCRQEGQRWWPRPCLTVDEIKNLAGVLFLHRVSVLPQPTVCWQLSCPSVLPCGISCALCARLDTRARANNSVWNGVHFLNVVFVSPPVVLSECGRCVFYRRHYAPVRKSV